ncbi:MAG: trypsin-like peptidase domain-containing protein, partial [Leptospiraceae bacterium]|nr:trypsin-like peptidase domain-containing protein [Leptospiraceae bacterium]
NPLNQNLSSEILKSIEERYVGIYSNDLIKGSGMQIDKNGYIITAYHVIQEIQPNEIKVSMDDKTFYSVELARIDKSKDLALLKSDLKINADFPQMEEQENLFNAEPIMLIGAPYELKKSFLKGYISNTKRENLDSSFPDIPFIQTHGTSYPGCSGGGVFLFNGKFIGINRATYGNSYGNSIGLVIPAIIIKEFIK